MATLPPASLFSSPTACANVASDTCTIFDRYGDIQPIGLGQQGLFHQETRYLSRLELQIQGHKPLLLSSVTGEDNVMVTVDLTNPDMEMPSGELLPRGTLHLCRNEFLADGVCRSDHNP